LFRLSQLGSASRIDTGRSGSAVCASAHHTSYARLDPPVVHERQVTVDGDGTVVIEDRFDHPEGHRFRWHFLLHPLVTPSGTPSTIRLTWAGGDATFEAAPFLSFAIVDGWYSPGYGVRQRTRALVATTADTPSTTRLTLRAPAGARQ
jgi:hypothetical protein